MLWEFVNWLLGYYDDFWYDLENRAQDDSPLCDDLKVFLESGNRLDYRDDGNSYYAVSTDPPNATLFGLVTRHRFAGVEAEVIADTAKQVSQRYYLWLLNNSPELEERETEQPGYADGLQERLRLVQRLYNCSQ